MKKVSAISLGLALALVGLLVNRCQHSQLKAGQPVQRVERVGRRKAELATGTIHVAKVLFWIAGFAAGVIVFGRIYRRLTWQAQTGPAPLKPPEQHPPNEEQQPTGEKEGGADPKKITSMSTGGDLPSKEGGPRRDNEPRLIDPFNKGGRPRVHGREAGEDAERERRPRSQKPEILCYKRERSWITSAQMPQDLFKLGDLSVSQNGSPLAQDKYREGCWNLAVACGRVEARWKEEDAHRSGACVDLGKDGCLIFKLRTQNQNLGYRVKSPSSGWYLVIVPANWDRDEVLSGPPPVEPEPTSLSGYLAHFFMIDGAGKIAFRREHDRPVVIDSKASLFQLVGAWLPDASEDVGPLFGGEPPRIRARNDDAWTTIGEVIVGEEGGGEAKGRWRCDVDPSQREQTMPPGVASGAGGWYFIRFYDKNNDFLDSIDFRFLAGLRGIALPSSPVPSGDGYLPVKVEFTHEPNYVVRPDDDVAKGIEVRPEGHKTTLVIPPRPDCDRSLWRVGSDNGPLVDVAVLVERLWWAVGQEDEVPSQWENKPLALSPADFAATSNKALWLRFPVRRWIDKVLVGFDQPEARPWRVTVTETTLCIPLREFSDAQQLRQVGQHQINLWFNRQGVPHTTPPCHLLVKAGCSACDFAASTEEEMSRHIESLHMDQFFRALTYDEMRAIFPSLPRAIYKCSYCSAYVESNDLRNPTSTICDHIEKQCLDAPRDMGLVKISFEIISDIDEIRKNLFSDLRRIHKCRLCGAPIELDTDRMQHLIQKHTRNLYSLR